MPRIILFLLALLGPGGGQILAGRRLRGWIIAAVAIALLVAVRWTPFALFGLVLVIVAAAVDAAILTPRGAWKAGWTHWLVLLMAWHSARLGYKQWVVETFKMRANGMAPTLIAGDHILAAKHDPSVARGDIVLFIYPENRDLTIVQRAVAIAGDRVELRGRRLYVNGATPEVGDARPCEYAERDETTGQWSRVAAQCIDERFDDRRYAVAHEPARSTSDLDVVVPPDHIFVLGDNRDSSLDSRSWGPVPVAKVVGKVTYVWWSSGPDGFRWDRLGLRIR
jgi:signal peptidase I